MATTPAVTRTRTLLLGVTLSKLDREKGVWSSFLSALYHTVVLPLLLLPFFLLLLVGTVGFPSAVYPRLLFVPIFALGTARLEELASSVCWALWLRAMIDDAPHFALPPDQHFMMKFKQANPLYRS